MPPNDRREILCDMEDTPDPQDRAAGPDELRLIATGITALVTKRILETKGDPCPQRMHTSVSRQAQTPTNRARSRPAQARGVTPIRTS